MEIIRKEGSGSPTELSESEYIRVSPQHVSRRLSTLADHGLLNHLGNGVYVITEEGKKYLDGELDAEDIEEESGEDGAATA